MASLALDRLDDTVFHQLGQVLWLWKFCAACDSKKPCSSTSCITQLAPRLQRYFQFYTGAVQTYVEECPLPQRLLKTHGHLLEGIQILTREPGMTRVEFRRRLYTLRGQEEPDNGSRDVTIFLVKILAMVDCSTLLYSSDRLEKGEHRTYWKEDVPFSKYIQDLFPITNHPALSYGDGDLMRNMKSDLRATKLHKHLKLRFRPTHDLSSHLRYDSRRNELEVFHYTSFVKEQLRMTRGSNVSPDSSDFPPS
jgi:hypothetical protein